MIVTNDCGRWLRFYFQDESFELDYNHLDFLWADNVRERLYNYIMD